MQHNGKHICTITDGMEMEAASSPSTWGTDMVELYIPWMRNRGAILGDRRY